MVTSLHHHPQVALARLRGPSPDWAGLERRVGDLFEPGLPGHGHGGGGGGWAAVRHCGDALLGKLLPLRRAGLGAPVPDPQNCPRGRRLHALRRRCPARNERRTLDVSLSALGFPEP